MPVRTVASHFKSARLSLDKAMAEINLCNKKGKPLPVTIGTQLKTLYSLLKDLKIAAIKEELNSGLSGEYVAARYNLSPARISQIKNMG